MFQEENAIFKKFHHIAKKESVVLGENIVLEVNAQKETKFVNQLQKQFAHIQNILVHGKRKEVATKNFAVK